MNSNVFVRTVDHDYALATWDQVLIQLWRGPMTSAAMNELRVQAKRFQTESRGPICSLSVVERRSPPPSDELRRALSAFYRENASAMAQQVVVAEGGGFRSALVRGVGIALSALAPKMLPFKFVPEVADAAKLISPHLSPKSGGSNGLLKAVEFLRQ
jgi:hypothetical protein